LHNPEKSLIIKQPQIKGVFMSDNLIHDPSKEKNESENRPERILTDKMVFHLQGASPWIRFIAILGFVFLGLSLIGSFIIIAVADAFEDLPGLGGGSGILIFVSTIPFLVIGFFYLYFTLQFGNKIKLYLYTKNSSDLEEAFKNNKSLWTLLGVVCIVSLAFFALAMLVVIAVAVFAADSLF